MVTRRYPGITNPKLVTNPQLEPLTEEQYNVLAPKKEPDPYEDQTRLLAEFTTQELRFAQIKLGNSSEAVQYYKKLVHILNSTNRAYVIKASYQGDTVFLKQICHPL